MSTWAQAWQGLSGSPSWKTSWDPFWARVRGTVVPAVERDPEAARDDVQRMMLVLADWRLVLNRAMTAASSLPTSTPAATAERAKAINEVVKHELRWQQYAAPFYAHTSQGGAPASSVPTIGVVPFVVVLVVGGVAVSALAAAWAMSSWQAANSDAARSGAYAQYLEAYAVSAKTGAPPPKPPDFEAIAATATDPLSRLVSSAGSLVGVLVVGALGVGALTWWMKRS